MIYCFVSGYVSQQQAACRHSHLVRPVFYCRHAGRDVCGMQVIGKSYQRHVFRYSQAELFYCGKGCESYYVVESEYGIGAVRSFQQFDGRLQGYVVVNLVAYHHVAVYRYFASTQRFEVSVLAASHHVKVVWSADKRYPPAAGVYEMLRGLLCGFVSVGRDGRETICQACPAEEHEGYSHIGDFFEVGVVCGALCQSGDDAFDM